MHWPFYPSSLVLGKLLFLMDLGVFPIANSYSRGFLRIRRDFARPLASGEVSQFHVRHEREMICKRGNDAKLLNSLGIWRDRVRKEIDEVPECANRAGGWLARSCWLEPQGPSIHFGLCGRGLWSCCRHQRQGGNVVFLAKDLSRSSDIFGR